MNVKDESEKKIKKFQLVMQQKDFDELNDYASRYGVSKSSITIKGIKTVIENDLLSIKI